MVKPIPDSRNRYSTALLASVSESSVSTWRVYETKMKWPTFASCGASTSES
jgi:hypothetical protein